LKIRCVLFDRDGTLGGLADDRYPETFSPYCPIREVFNELRVRGYTVGILTNQSSIARGTGKGYDFDGEFAAYGADLWEICPHDGKDNCDCRKPRSGMLRAAMAKTGYRPEEIIMVGDRLADLQCAINVGATGILVRTGRGKDEEATVRTQYPNAPILDRFDQILTILK
jgi:HAD superfamily hydrolase (TIGR01662 family)